MADEPETRLDRIARDSSRTWLHGSRVTDRALSVRPATIATGQQIPVDLPASGPMNFLFTAGAATTNVVISRADAIDSKSQMADALGANAAKYLTLSADPSIPTWIAGQRAFSIANPAPGEDRIDHLPVPGGPAAGLTLIKLPYAALGEVVESDAVVSLCRYDTAAKAMVEIPCAVWQPAVLLRFKLQPAPPTKGLATNEQIFEISGVPQGDRYYLDHLGLLDAQLARVSEPGQPDIAFVGLALQKGADAPSPISDWTILRTNLTREARSASARAAFSATPPSLPYVAVSSVDGDQDKDALRLLQMVSITNSGGYFLRVVGAPAGTDTLVLSIVLKSLPDSDPHNVESARLPRAANAVALTGTMPDSLRFNGVTHLQIAPAVPVGVLAFGWTRTEPASISDPEDRFGFGTISLIDYSALDGTGAQVGNFSEDTVVAISPTNPPSGDLIPRHRPRTIGGAASGLHQHTGDAAVLRPRPARQRPHASTITATDTVLRYYRSTLTCYDDKTDGSPYVRMADPQRSHVVFSPGFRDVFGNRFDAVAAPPVRRRLFYTDALIAPSEWPGIRFAIYPGQQNGKPFLFLEMQYSFLGVNEDKGPRVKRLKEVCNQLRGVNSDVIVVLSADPLASATTLSGAALADQVGTWIASEQANHLDHPDPLFKLWAAVPCSAAVGDLTHFKPTLKITRTRADLGPSATDLPSDSVIADKIKAQVMSAGSEVTLQASSSGPTNIEQLLAPAGGANDDAEFRAIAKAFQATVANAAKARVGFLRDRLNQHQLWLVPNAFFPTAAPGDWSFATARPLSTKPGAETFGVPDFDASCSTPSSDCWNGHPIVSRTVIDQDYDELGRIAFRLIEQQSVELGAMSARGNADAARKLLSARERIALSLASFGSQGGSGYIVPLFAAPGDVEPATATRIASDAFLSDLSAFYNVDTILQLPLAKAGDAKIQSFEGTTTATFTGSATALQPKVSNVLLGGSERKVTLLYDLPPGVLADGSVRRLATITARIHHVQMPLPDGSSARGNVFNQGAWLELAELPDAKSGDITWTAPSNGIQVADRRLPAKPLLQAAGTLLSGQNSLDASVVPPQSVDATSASLLVRWGWQFIFGLLAPGPNDTVHVTATYNRTPMATFRRAALAGNEWTPQSLLNVLYALKLLRDAPAGVGATERLQAASELASFLVAELSAHSLLVTSFAAQPEDNFVIKVPISGGPLTLPVPADVAGCAIMKGPVVVAWSGDAGQAIGTVTAKSDEVGNAAYLMGATAVRNFHLALRLRRNEMLGGVPANAEIIYECATVESPGDYWARNIWPARIEFDSGGKPLRTALQSFFEAVFRDGNLSTVKLEVGASLVWQAGQLTGVTPFFILPPDTTPGAGTAADLTNFVFGKYNELLKTGAPTDVALALRLRVKLATNDPPPQQLTLLDIAAIDFPV